MPTNMYEQCCERGLVLQAVKSNKRRLTTLSAYTYTTSFSLEACVFSKDIDLSQYLSTVKRPSMSAAPVVPITMSLNSFNEPPIAIDEQVCINGTDHAHYGVNKL